MGTRAREHSGHINRNQPQACKQLGLTREWQTVPWVTKPQYELPWAGYGASP